MTKTEKLAYAKSKCLEMGTSMEIVRMAGTVNASRVLKTCLANTSHQKMEVSLGSIVSLDRGGCATCARIKGGQTGKRTGSVTK